VVKESFKKIFNKSESYKKTGSGKIFIILLVILIVAIGAYLGYPFLFPGNANVTQDQNNEVVNNTVVKIIEKIDNPTAEKVKSKFDIEVEQREQGYEEKVFTYEPYIPPSNRNPFEKVRNFYSSELIAEVEDKMNAGLDAMGNMIKTFRPELPPGTALTGIIDSQDKKVAIIKMEDEKYIANLYDILADRYIVKEIKKEEVVIDFDGYLFSLKIGGEDLSDEL